MPHVMVEEAYSISTSYNFSERLRHHILAIRFTSIFSPESTRSAEREAVFVCKVSILKKSKLRFLESFRENIQDFANLKYGMVLLSSHSNCEISTIAQMLP